jgi:hypothetical protein
MKPIQAYGSNRRGGTATPILQALRAEGGEGLIIGLENETLAPTWEALDALQRLSPDDAPWTLERDGSLGERGVETVFRPSRNPLEGFRQWSVVAKAAGMLSGSATRYGCHISVDASAFRPLQLCFFASLLNGWRQIGETVGGRAQSSYACYGLSRVSHFRECTEKYRACSRRCHNRLEVRLFRSTLSPLRMQRYIDYIDAVAGVARRETPALLTLLRQTQRTPDGLQSSERWDGYPRWLGLARPLLARHCSPTLLRQIGGLI